VGRELRLLERLADSDEGVPRTIKGDTRQVADSVLRHLQQMLNTRQGHVLIQPDDYGMPDITDCSQSLPEVLDDVRRAIKRSIEKFEPRLRRVKITHQPVDDDLRLHFRISGELHVDNEKLDVYFRTTVTSTGSVELEG
jgi:type VI secretion system protein